MTEIQDWHSPAPPAPGPPAQRESKHREQPRWSTFKWKTADHLRQTTGVPTTLTWDLTGQYPPVRKNTQQKCAGTQRTWNGGQERQAIP